MFSLAKSMIGAAVLGVAAYGFFFIDLGGQSMASHVAEIWRTPVVQKKMELVRSSVRDELEKKLGEAGDKAGRDIARKLTRSGENEFSEIDRKALEDVLAQAHSGNQAGL